MSFYTDDYQILSFGVDRTDREEMRRRVDDKTVQFVAMALANAMVSRGSFLLLVVALVFWKDIKKKTTIVLWTTL